MKLGRRKLQHNYSSLPPRAPRRILLDNKPEVNYFAPTDRQKKTPILKGSTPVVAGVAGNGSSNWNGVDTGEYVSDLKGQKGRLIFDEMRRSDPEVGAVLEAIELPIRRANFYILPASDKKEDVEIARFIEDWLFTKMKITWDDELRHALLMNPFGFSILEKVWMVVDGKIVPKKLDPRLPMSIYDWYYDKNTGELVGAVQRDNAGKEYLLPIDKILVFTNKKEGDNWEGISILRKSYKPWFMKQTLEKIDAIKHDKYGVGIAVMHVPLGVNKDDPNYVDSIEALENIQAQEQSYIIEPEGYTFRIETGKNGAGSDTIPSIKYHDEQIAKGALAQFINLGTTQFGSRSLGVSLISFFLDSLQSQAQYICDIFNKFLIPEWVDYNWKVKNYPKLCVGQLERLDPDVLKKLIECKAITPDDELERVLRQQYRLPKDIGKAGKDRTQDTSKDKKVPEDDTDKPTEDDKDVQAE